MMTSSGTSSAEPVRGIQSCCWTSDAASDWSMPMAKPGENGRHQVLEPTDHRGGQRGHDEECVGHRASAG